ncbi:TPA: AAA family ATPase [Bacillus pseudomycoides]|nr:AAA family ATPase [Bacillus pseudomycoides]
MKNFYQAPNYEHLIKTLQQIFDRNKFGKFIHKITFPYYKNYLSNTTISFQFPFTVFVGRNGCGKSSALHALYGMPKGFSTEEFWFSTDLDPIKESSDGNRHCYFYEYYDGKELKQVLKSRMKRSASEDGTKKANPDYWETSKPVKKYGMNTGQRSSPIEKNVIYIDFRSELSAFDQFFYFGELSNKLASTKKQDYVRRKSTSLKNVIDQKSIIKVRGQVQNRKVTDLTQEELNVISYILDKKYQSGQIIEHKFFQNWSTSVLLENNTLKYSEAHAGSGEIAIVKLVHKLLHAQKESLILLDEPEVSLHPGAQKRLKLFLLDMIMKNKHQVIVSTHSSNFVEDLPEKSIKLFNQLPNDKVQVLDTCFPSQAFNVLGQTSPYVYEIIVEDSLAKRILEALLKRMGDEIASTFNISYYPGGASTIKNFQIKSFSLEESPRHFVILDGDQRLSGEIPDLDDIPGKDINTEMLQRIIKALTNVDVEFYTDGSKTKGGRTDQKLDAQKKYIDYYKNYVSFLPLKIPEEIIWDEEFVLNLPTVDSDTKRLVRESNNCKEKMYLASKKIFMSEDSVTSLENMLIAKWVQEESPEKKDILQIITCILTKINKNVLVKTG